MDAGSLNCHCLKRAVKSFLINQAESYFIPIFVFTYNADSEEIPSANGYDENRKKSSQSKKSEIMHLLAISLLTILAGTLLLAKMKKEDLGKFFSYISWFFVVVGFILFLIFIAGGICKMKHHCMPGKDECRQEMMMKGCPSGMPGGACCSPGMMGKECCPEMGKCMPHDSTMKCCAGHEGDTAKMASPKMKKEEKPK